MPTGVITIPAFATRRDGVRHFFGTRLSEGLPLNWPMSRGRAKPTVVAVEQVHGTNVLVLDRPVSPGAVFLGGWDALMTNQPGVLVTVRTADCVPVLLHDPVRRVVAAVHAGWRGAVAGIIPRTLETMRRRFGSTPDSLRVGIGPSVGACCYEVDEPVLSRLRAGFSDWKTVAVETGAGRAKLDLRLLVRLQAESRGVRPDGVHAVNLCTVCYPELFHSYRRDGTVRGTMVSGIFLTRGHDER
ncbi:peptidoglycan editing factor PgeF [Nitrospira sp. Kam-Ns4a]